MQLVQYLDDITPLPRAARLALILLATDPRRGPDLAVMDDQMWIFDLAVGGDPLLSLFATGGLALLQQKPDLARAFPFSCDVVMAADQCSDVATAALLRRLAAILGELREAG